MTFYGYTIIHLETNWIYALHIDCMYTVFLTKKSSLFQKLQQFFFLNSQQLKIKVPVSWAGE